MKKLLLTLGISAAIVTAFAQTSHSAKVTISSRGGDVKFTFADLFEQAHIPFVIQPNVRGTVYLSLRDESFEQALKILCETSGVVADLEDGVYHVHMPTTQASTNPSLPTSPITEKPAETPTVIKPTTSKPSAAKQTVGKPATVKGTPIVAEIRVLPISVLGKKVSARVAKTDIRKLFADFGKQAKIHIEISPEVPGYKIDAYLLNTSLKYALDKITDAAGLEYRFTQNYSIKISKPASTKIALNN